jgi:hypothetical protein
MRNYRLVLEINYKKDGVCKIDCQYSDWYPSRNEAYLMGIDEIKKKNNRIICYERSRSMYIEEKEIEIDNH